MTQKWLIGLSAERIGELNDAHIERFGLTGHWHHGITHPSNGTLAMPIHLDLVIQLTVEEQASLVEALDSSWVVDPLA